MQLLEILSAENLSVLSSIATAIGVGIAAYQLRVTRKQSVTTFEDSLTAQYRHVASTLPLKALLGESLTEDEHKKYIQYFYRYFDLCNEQAFLNKCGRVTKGTWIFWEDGIRTNIRRPAFSRAWQEVARRSIDDFSELRALCPPES